MTTPGDYLQRCRELERRGLSEGLAKRLRDAGDPFVLRAWERFSDDELRKVSEQATRAGMDE